MTAPNGGHDPEEVEHARVEVARALGRAVAEKATAAFCLSFAAPRTAAGDDFNVGLEAASTRATRGVGATAPTIIEFAPESAPPPRREPASVQRRAAAIAAARTRAYQAMGSVYAEVERVSTGALRGVRTANDEPAVSALLNQVCWLNRTVRTFAHPLSLAEVAQDESVATLDVPRRLTAEGWDLNMTAIGLPAWRDKGLPTGQDVIVAVIDSEVAFHHPVLAGRVVQRRNFTPEGWGNPHPHGTAVAGIIAAAGEEHGGVAPDVVLYNYKVLAGPVSAEDFAGSTAIQLALEDGAVVANCSWGAGPASDGTSREARAVDTAWSLGMVVVKSAGNDGPGAATMTSPADAEGVIVVGATNIDGTAIADYSSRGAVAGRVGPHVVAPGGSFDVRIESCHPGGGFAATDRPGTSFAAPHVAGIAAVLAEQNPDWEPDQIRDQVAKSSQELPGVDAAAQGAGLVRL